jgi:hypothetical protein
MRMACRVRARVQPLQHGLELVVFAQLRQREQHGGARRQRRFRIA